MKKTAMNIIVVGGPIAVGKSSLIASLPFKSIQELDSNDELQKILLEKMYEGDEIAAQVFQLDILLTRFDNYKHAVTTGETCVFDRTIFEDRLFAFLLLEKRKNVWDYYDAVWEDKVNEIINDIGKPSLYILLTFSWAEFKKRLFARNRKAETNNFSMNEAYFKKMLNMYEPFCVELFKKYDIPYVIIDTNNLNKLEVMEKTKIILQEKGLFNEG